MASKEKWTELFEKVIGRKPSPQEFLEGKKTDFDLKKIKEIAGQKPQEANALYNVADEAVLPEDGSLEPQAENLPSPTADQSSKEQWLAAFEKYIGRKPSPQEFVVGKTHQYDLTTINQFLETSKKPKSTPKLVKQPMSIWKKLGIAAGVLGAILVLIGYLYGSQYYSRQAVAERYLDVSKTSFDKSLEYQIWSDTGKPIKKSELTYRNPKDKTNVTMSDLMTSDQMRNAGRKFLIFPDWKVVVTPVTAQVSINTKGLDFYVNDKKVATTTSDSYQKKLTGLYPGNYTFLAKGKVSNQTVEIFSAEELTDDTTIKLNVKYLSFKVTSNLTDGDLYVGSRKIGTLKDGKYDVSKLAVTDSASVYVQKSFKDKGSLKSQTEAIENVSDGATLNLDAEGVLDRDTADSLVTAAYSKLQDYAYDNTTPDNLDDIFTGGNKNPFYADVTNTIDTNTIGAKNRSADSITFSDIDVSKVTQVGPTTYHLEFTVMYDFYYAYSSKHKTSGDIKQKLSWSAVVEYVGDDNNGDSSYYYNNYSDYRITSGNGASSVISTEDTVD